MAKFDGTIPPGGEGKITLRVDTSGYGGRKILKTATVFSNDPDHRFEHLNMEAFVKSVIFVSMDVVHLEGRAGQVVTRIVEIRGEKEAPLRIHPVYFELAKRVAYQIEEVTPGKAYRVHFHNLSVQEQSYRGVLRLKTTYPEKPEILLWVVGNFRS